MGTSTQRNTEFEYRVLIALRDFKHPPTRRTHFVLFTFLQTTEILHVSNLTKVVARIKSLDENKKIGGYGKSTSAFQQAENFLCNVM